MSKDFDLFGKTFDQQVDAAGDAIIKEDISPNTRISAEIVFEPLETGVRITARDDKHRVLWGFIGSQGILGQAHCPVAIYDVLESLLSEELKKKGLPFNTDDSSPLEAARRALVDIHSTLDRLKESLDVKKISPATTARARVIARVVKDVNRQIDLETR